MVTGLALIMMELLTTLPGQYPGPPFCFPVAEPAIDRSENSLSILPIRLQKNSFGEMRG